MTEKKITCYLCCQEINTNLCCCINIEEEIIVENLVRTLNNRKYYFCLKCYFKEVYKKEYIFKDFGEY